MRQRIFAWLVAASSAVACTVTVGAGAATAGVAGVSGSWTIQSTYYPPTAPKKDIALEAVSCPASDACLAIGRAGAKLLSETWNGTTWSPLLTALPPGVLQFTDLSCSGPSACTAIAFTGGAPLAERWNGTSWQAQTVPGPSGASLYGVSCPGAGSCIAVGSHKTGSQAYATLAEAWNGTSWTVQPTPPTGSSEASLTDVSCPASSDCVAIGSAGNNPTQQVPFIGRWNGTNWAIQKTPALSGTSLPFLSSVSCSAASSCTAIGSYQTSSGEQPLVEHWNGTSWVLQPVPGATNHVLDAVSCPSATSCTATGYYANSANVLVTLAAHWNGHAWAIQPTPNPAHATESSFSDVSCPTITVCEAVGLTHATTKTGGLQDKTLIEGN